MNVITTKKLPTLSESGLDPLLVSQIELLYEAQDFELGEEIYKLISPASNRASSETNNSEECIYIISEGRVRLLCHSSDRSREVSAGLLEAGCIVGGDESFAPIHPVPYRAIAASECRIICIPLRELEQLSKRFTQLKPTVIHQCTQKERLLFLRSCSNLQSISSKVLESLAQMLEIIKIDAGILLAKSLPASGGHYWLRSGQIDSVEHNADGKNNGDRLLTTIGQSWGYPHSVTETWRAQTSLCVYKLSKEAWDTLLPHIPNLDRLCQAKNDSVFQKTNGNTVNHHKKVNLVATTSRNGSSHSLSRTKVYSPVTQQSPSVEDTQSGSIEFPKATSKRILNLLGLFPFIQQQSTSDCGVACLAMISLYWGKRFPLHKLRELANVGVSGASLKSLAKAAEVVGFNARPVRASLSRLIDEQNPWIAHWEGNHFVVVYSIKGENVIYADPALGCKKITLKEFESHWTGFALLLTPTSRLKDIEIEQGTFWRFLGALSPFKKVITQIIIASVLIQLFALFSPLFTQIIMDRVVVQRSQSTLNIIVIGLILFSFWKIVINSARSYLMSYFSNHLNLTLITAFIHHTLKLPISFFESRRVGDILTRVQENNKIQRFLIKQVLLAWLGFATGFVYLGLMLYYNARLTFLVLALIPPIAIVTLLATPFLRRISREVFKERADQNSSLVEMLNGISTLKSAAIEKELRWRWEDHFTRLLNVRFKGQKFGIALSAINGTINTLGSAALLWYGATLVIQDQLTIGQLVAFNMMIGHVLSPVLALANLWDELQEITISVERLNDVFEAEPEDQNIQSMLSLPRINGRVRFADVTFRYNEDEQRNTLQNINFEVQAGETIAIVGRSGSGKTTLVKLLEALYKPNSGTIYIDDFDISHISPPTLRSQFGVVPQECFLFSGTIAENITLFRSEYSLEQVIEVSKLAEAHAFIQSFPLGYKTKVGEHGATLSGGQRQRIAIARALLGNPRILVLDEATSSLDTESERRFQKNLEDISDGRTTFIIAHRLSTVRNVDRILVIDRGVLVEQGNHEELMIKEGLYYHLARQQLAV